MAEEIQERKNKLLVWVQKDYWYIVLCLITLGVCGWTILHVDNYCSDITAKQCIGFCNVKEMEMQNRINTKSSFKDIMGLVEKSNNPICQNLNYISQACDRISWSDYGNQA